MADSSKSIQVNISVIVDQAKSALSEMSATVNQTTQTLTQMGAGAQTGMAGVSAGMDKAKDSSKGFFDSTTTGVLKGLASYDLLKKSITEVVGFLGDSIKESMQASATMALVANNVTNAGMSYDKIKGQLKEYADAQIQMGFDDEATALSVSKLLIITKDYGQALQLNQLAMDLARSKQIDIGTATTLVAQVTQGNTRALREYGIGMKETSSIADVLTEAHDKLKNSAQAYADTTAGKLEIVTQQWDNMKQEIGDSLMPKINELFVEFEKHMPEIEEFLKATVQLIGYVADGIGILIKPFQVLGFAIGNVMNLVEGKPLASFNDMLFGTADATATLSKKTEEAAVNFAGIGKNSKDAAKSLADAQQDVQALTDALGKVINKQQEFVFNAQTDFDRFKGIIANTGMAQATWITQTTQGFDALAGKIKTTNDSIATLQQKLTDIGNSYNDFVNSTTKSSGDTFADIVFKAQQSIQTLPADIAKAQAQGQDTTALQKQLKDAQDTVAESLKSQYQSNVEFQSQLALLQKQSKENSLAAAYDEMQKKIADKMQESMVELAQVNAQIAAEKNKRDQLQAFEDATTASFAAAVKERAKSVSAEVGNLAAVQTAAQNASAAYDALALSMSKSRGATVSPFTISGSTPARAGGGPVDAGQAYLVGENGPELFMPSVSGGIVPNDKVSANGGQTIININNPTVRSDNDITMIIRSVTDALDRRDELAKLGAYK